MGKSYVKSFQGLRWFACLLVFLSHSVSQLGLSANLGAACSVVIFFTLSGFLAQMKYSEHGWGYSSILSECKNSFIHSAKKFYPLHWVVLLLVLAPTILYGEDSPLVLVIKFLLNATLLQCWIPNTSFAYSFNGVSWFLSVTMFFALISPLVVKAVAKLSWRISLLFLVVILCLQIGVAFCPTPSLNLFIYVFPPIRILDCVAGCLLYRLSDLFKENIKSSLVNLIFFVSLLLWIGSMLIVNLVTAPGLYGSLFRVAIWSVPAWGIVFALSRENELLSGIKVIFANRAVVFLGGITFEFYLIHKEILNCGSEGFRMFFHCDANIVMIVIAFFASLSLALAVHFLDKILRRKWKNRNMKKATSNEKLK